MTISKVSQIVLLTAFVQLMSSTFALAAAQTTDQLFIQAQSLLDHKHISDARKILREITARSDAKPVMFCALAETYLDVETDEDTGPGCTAAMRGVEAALQKDPECGRAYKCMATFANLRGRYELALQYANRAMTAKKPNLSARRQRALAYSHLNRIPEAIKDVQDFISEGHPTTLNYMLLGDLQRSSKKYADAEVSYRKAMTESSTFSQRCLNLLVKCLAAEGKNEEVVKELTVRLNSDPMDAEMHDLRGQYLMKLKRYKEALDDCSTAIGQMNTSMFYEHRAACYDLLGKKSLADADRAQAKNRGPDDLRLF